MQINTLSSSKLEQARLCEARLAGKLGQIAGETDYEEDRGEGAAIGGLAHAAAKVWYRPNPDWVKAMQLAATQVPPEQREHHLNSVSAQLSTQGIFKHPVTDPDIAFRQAIDESSRGQYGNELPREPSSLTEARTMFDRIITFYKRDLLNVVFAERRYKGQLLSDVNGNPGSGVPVHLIIDLGVDRGGGRLEIIDFKTGFISIPTEEMYDKDQALMNLLAVRKYDPEITPYHTVSFTYFWVRDSIERGPISIPTDRLIDYEYWLTITYQRLLNLTDPTETTNRFCKSCGRRFQCKAYQEFVGEAMGEFRALTEAEMQDLFTGDPEKLLIRYDRLSGQLKLLEDAKSNISKFITNRMESTGQKLIEGEHYKAALRANRRDDYDTGAVLSACAIYGVDPTSVVSASKSKVEAAFSKNVEAMDLLGQQMRRGGDEWAWGDVVIQLQVKGLDHSSFLTVTGQCTLAALACPARGW